MASTPRSGSTASAVLEFLKQRPKGATMAEIADTIGQRRNVQRHSIRSAVLSNVQGKGMELFVQDRPKDGGRAIYRLK